VTSSQVRVRSAQGEDAEKVWPLAEAFATSYNVERRVYEESFRTLVRAPNTLLAVAEGRSEIVGYLLATQHLTL
jgi:hypothetical protein